jgi:hypothetical protein
MKVLKLLAAKRTLAKNYNLAQMIANVIALHQPSRGGANAYCVECTGIARNWVDYPCSTIDQIRKEL